MLKPIVSLAIIQARKWQVASLNEFRGFFGLKAHKSFEEFSPDPYVGGTLKNLYGHVDRVELYPGLSLEKKASAPDTRRLSVMTYSTVMRALFSSGIASVRGDRFFAIVSYYPFMFTLRIDVYTMSVVASLRIILQPTLRTGATQRSLQTTRSSVVRSCIN